MVITLLLLIAPAAHAADLPPGIVADKPAEGRFVEITAGPHAGRYMIEYTHRFLGPNGKVFAMRMSPIPGGEFVMGSPTNEKSRKSDEGPPVRVRVEPMWIGVYEVTWEQFTPYMQLFEVARAEDKLTLHGVADEKREPEADAVSVPSPPYSQWTLPILLKMGNDDCDPVSGISELTARQYTRYLTLRSGAFFRLPTEAEWEHAARAGTTTAYFFGDDAAKLGEYAWYFENSEWKDNPDRGHPDVGAGYRRVGLKKPNPWGLYDVYGNVSEWCVDQHDDQHYAALARRGLSVDAANAIRWPTQRWRRVTRGGHWDSDAKECRSAARDASIVEWSSFDPQVPKDPWTHTEFWMGFRVVRPLIKPNEAEMARFWSTHSDDLVKAARAMGWRVKVIRADPPPAKDDEPEPCIPKTVAPPPSPRSNAP